MHECTHTHTSLGLVVTFKCKALCSSLRSVEINCLHTHNKTLPIVIPLHNSINGTALNVYAKFKECILTKVSLFQGENRIRTEDIGTCFYQPMSTVITTQQGEQTAHGTSPFSCNDKLVTPSMVSICWYKSINIVDPT